MTLFWVLQLPVWHKYVFGVYITQDKAGAGCISVRRRCSQNRGLFDIARRGYCCDLF